MIKNKRLKNRIIKEIFKVYQSLKGILKVGLKNIIFE